MKIILETFKIAFGIVWVGILSLFALLGISTILVGDSIDEFKRIFFKGENNE